MRQQLAKRDCDVRVPGVTNRKGQEVVNVGIERDAVLFDQLHHDRGGDGLGNRGELEERLLIHWFLVTDVGPAVRAGPEDLSILDNCCCQAGDSGLFHPLQDELIEAGRIGRAGKVLQLAESILGMEGTAHSQPENDECQQKVFVNRLHGPLCRATR